MTGWRPVTKDILIAAAARNSFGVDTVTYDAALKAAELLLARARHGHGPSRQAVEEALDHMARARIAWAVRSMRVVVEVSPDHSMFRAPMLDRIEQLAKGDDTQ